MYTSQLRSGYSILPKLIHVWDRQQQNICPNCRELHMTQLHIQLPLQNHPSNPKQSLGQETGGCMLPWTI